MCGSEILKSGILGRPSLTVLVSWCPSTVLVLVMPVVFEFELE